MPRSFTFPQILYSYLPDLVSFKYAKPADLTYLFSAKGTPMISLTKAALPIGSNRKEVVIMS